MQYLFQAEKIQLGSAAVSLRLANGETCAVLHRRQDPVSQKFLQVLTGQCLPDGGSMLLSGEAYQPFHVRDALRLGVEMGDQVFGSLTVKQNLALFVNDPDPGRIREALPNVRPNLKADKLTREEKARLLLLRARLRGSRLLILREPFAHMDPDARSGLMDQLRAFAQEDRGFVYTTISPSDAKLADKCAVLGPDGVVWFGDPSAVSARTLADLLCGAEGGCLPERRDSVPGAVVMEVRGLCVRPARSAAIEGVSLEIRENEILGICALPGNGGETLLETLAGFHNLRQGRIRLMGSDTARMRPTDLYRKGVRFLPDLTTQDEGERTVTEALVLSRLRLPGFWTHGFARKKQMRAYADWIVKEYGIDADVHDAMDALPRPVRAQIGQCGELDRSGAVLLLEYPSKELDAHGAQTLWDCLNQEKAQRTGILYLSDSPEEVLNLCDRVAVMREGRIVCSLDCLNTTENEILRALAGDNSFSYDVPLEEQDL